MKKLRLRENHKYNLKEIKSDKINIKIKENNFCSKECLIEFLVKKMKCIKCEKMLNDEFGFYNLDNTKLYCENCAKELQIDLGDLVSIDKAGKIEE